MSKQAYGKYIVITLLGRGGMAEVYEANDPLLDRKVAVKVIHAHLANEVGFGDRFHHEAKLVASLRHPHIIQLYDYDVTEGQPFMVMEFLDGGVLKDKLERFKKAGQRMPLEEVAHLLDDLASALDYAHAHGAVHRDIKPANILFTAQGEPVLTDFGIAKLFGQFSQMTMTGTVVGSPAYMSPEQALGKQVDARSDLYSLGCVIYEMVTGRPPFESDTPTATMLQHINTTPPPPRQFNTDLPESVEKVILKALSKEPKERYETAGEMARAFRAAIATVAATGAVADETTITKSLESTQVNQPAGATLVQAAAPQPTMVTSKPKQAAPPEIPESATLVSPAVEEAARKEASKSVPEKKKEKGPLIPVLVVALIVILGGGGWFAFTQLRSKPAAPVVTSTLAILNMTPDATKTGPGGKVKIQSAAAPDGSTLKFSWAAEGGNFNNSQGQNVEWTAPDKTGTYKITLTVIDGSGKSTSQVVSIDVGNSPPKIESLKADPELISPGRITTITVVASDPDGDPLTAASYSWSADKGQVNGPGNKVTYQAPAQAGKYTVKVTVTDGKGGEDSKTVEISVSADQLKVALQPKDDETGTVWSNGKIDPRMLAGDDNFNASARAFFSYDLTSYLKRTISGATLNFRTKGFSGDPFSSGKGLGGFVMELVNYPSHPLTAKDFDIKGGGAITLVYATATELDVTPLVLAGVQSGEGVFHLRVRFNSATNNNGIGDYAEFVDPILTLTYK